MYVKQNKIPLLKINRSDSYFTASRLNLLADFIIDQIINIVGNFH